jgi:hypothetical protein
VKLDYDYGSQSVEERAIGNWEAIISRKSECQGATKKVSRCRIVRSIARIGSDMPNAFLSYI